MKEIVMKEIVNGLCFGFGVVLIFTVVFSVYDILEDEKCVDGIVYIVDDDGFYREDLSPTKCITIDE